MTWNPFKKQDAAPQDSAADAHPEATAGKGRPTPKRKQAQAQNLRPLVPQDRKATARAAKARRRQREDEQYEAMRTGDLNHMPKAERLPDRIYMRDYIDARFNLAEFFVPIAFIILIAMMVFSAITPVIGIAIMVPLYLYLLAAVIDIAIMWRGLKKKLIAKFGPQVVAKGRRSFSYAMGRAIQLRRWRLPKPRHSKRGHWPE